MSAYPHKLALFAWTQYLGKVYIIIYNILCFLLTFILGDVIMANVGRFSNATKYSYKKVGVIQCFR